MLNIIGLFATIEHHLVVGWLFKRFSFTPAHYLTSLTHPQISRPILRLKVDYYCYKVLFE